MCKVFPSSLGPVAMRWFEGLGAGSISSFKEFTWAFGSCFVTCSRVPWLLDSLLSMTMRERETQKTYSDKYLEMFNEINRNFNDVAIKTFKAGLSAEYDLRKSLTRKPVGSVRQFMDRIDKYKRVEEDNNKGNGKLRWSHRIEGILGQIDIIVTDLGEILLGNPNLLLLTWLASCSKSSCTKSWKKLRVSRTFNGQIRWKETPRGVTRAFTANTTKSGGTL